MSFNMNDVTRAHVSIGNHIIQSHERIYLIDTEYSKYIAMKIIKERSKNKKVYLFYISSGDYDEACFTLDNVMSCIIDDDDNIVIADILTSMKISRKFKNPIEIKKYFKSFIQENESDDNVEYVTVIDNFSNTTKRQSTKTYQNIKCLIEHMDLTLALESPSMAPKTYTIEKLMVFDVLCEVPSHTQFLKAFYNNYDFYEDLIYDGRYMKAQDVLNVFYRESCNHKYELNPKTSSMINKDVIKNYIKQHTFIGDMHGY